MFVPPPGLDVGDSFFARYARDEQGNLMPGRSMSVCTHRAWLCADRSGSRVRILAASACTLVGQRTDPWWTLLLFFNSLRELGTTLSLFQSDIPDRFKVIRNRVGLEWSDV